MQQQQNRLIKKRNGMERIIRERQKLIYEIMIDWRFLWLLNYGLDEWLRLFILNLVELEIRVKVQLYCLFK